jgi:hypothetical protein
MRISDDGKYILQIAFALNFQKELQNQFDRHLKATKSLDVLLANQYEIQTLHLNSDKNIKQPFKNYIDKIQS